MAWNLFKYMCTENDNYQLFMEREETTEVAPVNKEQNATKNSNDEDNKEV